MSDQQLQSSKNELLVLHPKPRVERAVRGEHAQTQLQRDIHSVHPAAKGFLEGCVLFYHHLKEGMQYYWKQLPMPQIFERTPTSTGCSTKKSCRSLQLCVGRRNWGIQAAGVWHV